MAAAPVSPIEEVEGRARIGAHGTSAHQHPLLEHPEISGLLLGGVGLQGTVQTAVSTLMTAPCGRTQQTRPGAHGRWKVGSGPIDGEYVWHTSPARAGPLGGRFASEPSPDAEARRTVVCASGAAANEGSTFGSRIGFPDGSTAAWVSAADDAPSSEGSGFVAAGCGVQDARTRLTPPFATT
jgi:hypothetical protein